MARARPSPPPAPPWRRDALLAAAVVAIGVAAYSNSFHGEFVFDDLEQIVDNAAIRDLGTFLGPAGYRLAPNRYVAYVTFALNHAAGGYHPVGWHVVNLAIHLAVALLVQAFVLVAFRAPRLRASALAPAAPAVAFAAAALFVSHPLATQAVSYVVQRITSLATLFYLGAAVLWLAFRLRPPGPARAALYAGVLLSALLAVRSKEIAFTLPLGLALVEGLLLEGGRRRWLALLPVALVALLVPITLVDLGRPASEVLATADASTRVLAPAGRLDYLRTQVVVVVDYLRLLALPVGQSIDHDVVIRRSWLAPDVALSALGLASLAGLAAWLAWRSRPRGGRPPLDPAVLLLSLGILWFFVTLSVESSVIPIADVMNEHRVYLPSAGLFPGLAAGAGLLLLRLGSRNVARDLGVGAGVLSCLLGVATWSRNRAWQSELALWSDAAAKAPNHYRPVYNWGATLTKLERYAEAAAVLRRGVDLDPRSTVARVQLGVVLYLSGDVRGAEVELRRAVELDSVNADALLNLSVFLVATGRPGEARIWLERLRATAKDPADRAWAEAELAKLPPEPAQPGR